MTTQLRVYRLPMEADAQAEWLTWWADVRTMREHFGFRVVAAVLDDEAAEFAWIVEHDGDFDAAEQQMMASAERAEIFARPRPEMTTIRTQVVRRVA